MADEGGTGWMYNPNGDVNNEEYLLGKKIGKNFDAQGTMGQINAVEYDVAPPSIFASQAAHQVDLQRKLMEDPLVAIKKREMEDRKKLMDNPIKMRALKEHISDLKESKKKKKKKKKKRGSDSDSDVDLDIKLLEKIQAMEGHFTGHEGGKSRDSSSSPPHRRQRPDNSPPTERGQTSNTSVRFPGAPGRNRRRSPSDSPPTERGHASKTTVRFPGAPGRNRRRSPSDSPPRRRRSPSDSPLRRRRSPQNSHNRRRRYSNDSPPMKREPPSRRSPDEPRRRSRDPSSRKSPAEPRRREPPRRRSPSNSPQRRLARSPDEPRRSRSPRRPRSRSKSSQGKGKNYMNQRPTSPPPRRVRTEDSGPPAKKTGMTDEEKQAKLAEMMANASWRDDQRSQRVKKYRDGQIKEDEEAKREHDPTFMNRELKRAQDSLTVEGRITANKYKIQRGVGDMDQNFARR